LSIFDIELDHVTKRFGDFTAVDDVSFGVEKGEFVTLLGPSGCGKTTTLRMVGGFIFPTTGEISINGVPMRRRPPNKRDSSMVFQNYALFPHMNIFENVAFGLKERKMPKQTIRQKVRDILELVGLSGFENRKPIQLSGGQQQRVALARSLVLEPTVLLLDEPLGALDLKMRKQMQEEVKALQLRLGITFIYVTHDQEEALVMSNTIAVMNKGRIEQIGPPKEIYERPRNQFVAKFIGEANIFQGILTDCNDRWATISLAGCSVTISNDQSLQKGELVEFIVRPEKILLGEPAQHAETTFHAEVARVVYKGSIATIVLKFGDLLEIQAQEQITGHKSTYEIGDKVVTGWLAESAVPIQSE
jgi:spermidine/putrescine transport system ATP-binding protein